MSNTKEKSKDKSLNEKFTLNDDFPIPSYEEWKESAEKLLKGKDFEKSLKTKTYEDIILEPIYTRKNSKNLNAFTKTNPTSFKRTDSTYPNEWEICQELNYSSIKDYNTALKNALKNGQNAIFIDFVRLNIENVNGLIEALDDINIEKYPIYVKNDYSQIKVAKILSEYIELKNINGENVFGGIIASPIEYLAEKGFLPVEPRKIYDELSELFKIFHKTYPNIKFFTVSGNIFNNAGADSITELAVSMSIAVEYIGEMLSRGIDIDSLSNAFSFRLGIGSNFFMETAKFRALKPLYKKIIKEFGGKTDNIHIQAKTSLFNKTKLDFFVNTLRTTTETFSAILGGVNLITTDPYDICMNDNKILSERIARNIQIILKEESNLKRLIDPAGGSYYIEALTKEIIEKAWKEFQNIEKEGGILEALKSGYIQDRIEKTANKKKADLFKRKSVIIGTNKFVNLKDKVTGDEDKDETTAKKGVISIKKLNMIRLAEPFEDLRKAVSDYEKREGKLPSVFLANFGTVKQYKARADFSREYFEVGGFEVIYSEGFNEIDNAARAASENKAEIVVICSDDESYPEIVEKYIPALTDKKTIILAGYPKEKESFYREKGVDDFIYIGSNIYETLKNLLRKEGVLK